MKLLRELKSYLNAAISEKYFLEKFKDWERKYDGFIIACRSDIAIELLRELSFKPVIGIGEASMLYSLPLGHKFSILSLKRKKYSKKRI